MAKGLPWFAFNYNDFRRDTKHLKLEEVGAYVRLLGELWDAGWLPDDDAALAQRIGLTPTLFRRRMSVVRGFFMPHPFHAGALTQKRMAADLYKAGNRFGFLLTEDGTITRTGEPAPQEARQAKAEERRAAAARPCARPASPVPAAAESTEKPAENPPNTADSIHKETCKIKELALQRKEREEDSPPLPLREAPPSHAAEPRGKRLPEGWTPGVAGMAYARGKGLDPESTAEEFTAYWRAEGGARARKVDWLSAWQVWCLKAVRHDRRPVPPANRSLPLFAVAGGRDSQRPIVMTQPKAVSADDPWGIKALCAAMLDHGARLSADRYGVQRTEFRACFLDLTARDVACAAKLRGDEQPDWSPLIQWIEAGIPAARIIAGVRRVAGFKDYVPGGSLRRFDSTIRGEQHRSAA